MIKLSLKGLADFMTSGPRRQRNILRNYKYPDEGFFPATYYKEARLHIDAYHKYNRQPNWLSKIEQGLRLEAAHSSGRTVDRLKNNARILRHYRNHFSEKKYELLDDLLLTLSFHDVIITVTPDLHVLESNTEKLVKLEFTSKKPKDTVRLIITQALFEASEQAGMGLSSRQILYVDIPRGLEHLGARMGSRRRSEIEAACQNISAIWPTI